MMLKLLLILFISLLFQACQVKEQVTGAKQTATNFFPGATLQTVLAGNGWKKLGDDIDVSLRFPLPITVTNSPYIDAQIGSSTRRFYYESGSGTKNLIFRYTVTSADLDTGGITFDDNIELNGGTLKYSPGGSVVENVPTGLDIPPSEIKVDGVVPYPTQTIAPTGGNYATGQQLKYRLLYSEKVFVTGAPTFSIDLSSSTVTSKYKSGSGTANLEFSRLLAVADSDVDGFTSGTLLSLSSVITITDEAGNSVPSTIYTTTSTNILVNVVQPIITSVTPPAPATYTAGQNLDFTLLMSEAVDVTGTPAITIALNTGTVLATYLSGTGTNTLIYRYTVLTNHVDIDGITLRSPMNLRGGTIKNLAATHNAAMIYTVPATPTVYVDASTGPYVVTVARPINGTYLESVNFNFTLNFNAIVNVIGTPRFPIIIGTTTVYATYLSGTGSSSLIFRYTTTTNDLDLDGISLSGPVELNGGTIRDVGNRPAILSYVPPDTTGILVDGTSPAIILASSAGPENLITGEYLYFSLKFNKVVNIVAPYPTLTVTVGLNPQSAIYISGTGTDTLNFRYTAQIGDDDTDGVVITSPLLTTGTIKDIRGHNAILTFTDFNTGYNIDGVSSTVSSFVLPTAPPANGYKIGDTLDFEVQWSEATFITGSPRLVLQVGSSTLYASYLSSGSTVMSSIFRYTVLAGHLDSNGITTTGLELNGGQLKDASGNNADYSIAIFTEPNLYEIDGVVPFATITSSPANITHKLGSTLVFNLQWNEDVTIVGTPALNLMIGSTTVTTTFLQTGTNTASFSYLVLPLQMDSDGIGLVSGISLLGGATIKDAAGNNSYLHINVPDLTNVRIDATVPTLLGVSGPANGTYKLGDTIDFVATWSEPVVVTGTPGITLTFMTGAVLQAVFVAPTSSPSTTSTFRYTVTSIDGDSDGIGMAASISLNGGNIRDVATNDANPITFAVPTLTGVLVDGVTGTILSWTFPSAGTYAIGDNLDFTVTWSRNVTLDTSVTLGDDACLVIYTNNLINACYISGSGTNTLLFRHIVTSGESSIPNAGLYVWGTVFLVGTATIKDPSPFDVYKEFPGSSGWNNDPTVIVDGIPPLVSSSTSINITDVSRPNYFKSGHTIEYNITFDSPVVVTGSPRLTLNIGGATRYADFNLAATTAADPTGLNTSKRFRYTLNAGDVLLDLDGIGVGTSIDMNGGSITDVSGNDFVATFTFGISGEKDYVYYNSTLARYHVSDSDYSAATCGVSDLCVTGLTDITGNGHNLITSSPGPQILSGVNGFGTNLTNVMKFDNLSALYTQTPSWMWIKYVIVVMKTVTDASVVAGTSTHTILNRNTNWSPTYIPTVQLSSSISTKSILMDPIQKMKINDAAFPAAPTAIETDPTLWAADTSYIMGFELNAANWFWFASTIGGSSFNGQIAEIIFLSDSPAITEVGHVDTIITQLNTIHGVY